MFLLRDKVSAILGVWESFISVEEWVVASSQIVFTDGAATPSPANARPNLRPLLHHDALNTNRKSGVAFPVFPTHSPLCGAALHNKTERH